MPNFSKIKNSQNFRKGVFHVKIDTKTEFERLREILWDLGKNAKNKMFEFNIKLSKEIQPSDDEPYMSGTQKNYKEHLEYVLNWQGKQLPNITINLT